MSPEPTEAGVVTDEAPPGRVVLGVGALDRLPEELLRLWCRWWPRSAGRWPGR